MLITEGKTKRILASATPQEVLLETKDDLTGGDAAKRETIAGIAVHKTAQARHVFELLNRRGIPTAYLGAESPVRLRCAACTMLPLELVTRRYAWGSYLKRDPALAGSKPHRFAELKTEFFHKHACVVPPLVPKPVQMDEGKARELYLKGGVWADGVYTDPFIRIEKGRWYLHSAKVPVDPARTLMETPALLNPEETEFLIRRIMIPVFEALEQAWAKVETAGGRVALVDLKIECGRRQRDGKLVVADVVDNDSWRIWPGADPARQLDKQLFRDGHALSEVAEKYELVARLTESFARS